MLYVDFLRSSFHLPKRTPDNVRIGILHLLEFQVPVYEILVRLDLDLLGVSFLIHVILLDKGIYELNGTPTDLDTVQEGRYLYLGVEKDGQEAAFRTAVLAKELCI